MNPFDTRLYSVIHILLVLLTLVLASTRPNLGWSEENPDNNSETLDTKPTSGPTVEFREVPASEFKENKSKERLEIVLPEVGSGGFEVADLSSGTVGKSILAP